VASFAPAHFVKITKLNALPGETAEAFEVRRHTLEETSNEIVMHWVPRAMFVDVPIFAALVALAARRSGRNYPQHLYFSLHVHGAWFLMATLPTAVGIAAPRAGKSIGSVVMLWGLVYFVMAFRRAYGATIVRSTVSAVAVGVAYFVVVLISLMAIAFPYAYRAGILGK
jgi:hypothetical protein